jgi:uncharacterized protein YbcI
MATSDRADQAAPALDQPARDAQRDQLAAVTRAMVKIYKEQFGRGPRHAYTHDAGTNAITCFLEGTMTPLERRLADAGEHDRLRDIRLWFQYSAEAQFRAGVEQATGRRIVAFISGIDTRADVSIETFTLE